MIRDTPLCLRDGLASEYVPRGHGVHVNGDNACAQDVTTAFLVEGDLPAQDTSCPA